MAVSFPIVSDRPLLHQGRSFAQLPDRDAAPRLLAEIATVPCSFSRVLADRPLAIYGAGNLGRLARDVLQTIGIVPVMVIDRNASSMAPEPEWSGVRLLHPDDVTGSDRRDVCAAVCIATQPYLPIERSLSELGFEHIVPFYDLAESYRRLHPLSNGWFAPPMPVEDRERTAEVLSNWNDDVSRAHHLQFLAWRRLREEWCFDAAPLQDDRFFIAEIASLLHGQETFVDAGAYRGTVTQSFLERTKGAFRHIVAIEPDPASRAALKEALQAALPDDPRVTALDCALGAGHGEASFHDGLGYASQISETGKMRVALRPLDAFGYNPTFIKLHLEGAELPALQGARETMLGSRPLLAVTVYHNADGIWRTPLWLMQTLPRYRFLFRAHSWCGTGAVIYAIPQERLA